MRSFLNDLGKKLMYSFHLMTHPFDGFWDLKNEKRGSMPAAVVIVLLMVLTRILGRQYRGYIFNTNDLAELNILTEFFSIVLPFVVWCVANWCFTTLFDGEGTMKDIFIYSAYALVPYIVFNLPMIFISRFIVQEEASIYNAILTIGLIWTIFLFFIGTLTTHQYTAGKTFLIIAVTIVGMGIILFMGLLFFILLQQLINFVLSLIKDISLRIA